MAKTPYMEADCPLCQSRIEIMNLDWRCPCCGRLNRNWDCIQNCEICRFGPYWFPCRECGGEFEISLLMGEYRDKDGNVLPPVAKPICEGGQEFRLRDLRPGAIPAISSSESDLRNLAKLLMLAKECRFQFACPVTSYIAYQVWVSEDDRYWVHGFLHSNGEANDSNRVGQMSIVAEMGADGSPTSPKFALVEAFPAARSFQLQEAASPGEREASSGQRGHAIRDLLMSNNVLISPEIQNSPVFPFTMDKARRFFREFEDECFLLEERVGSMVIHSGKQNLPSHSFASGVLFSETLDELERLGRFPDPVASIQMECGGGLTGPQLKVTKMR